MALEHDFKKFPELTNSQMETLYFSSPHKQITRDFFGKVEKVTDGDTIQMSMDERDFSFPVRLLGIDTKELGEGGENAKRFLTEQIEGDEVTVKIDPKQRVGKFGRLLGKIISRGMDVGDMMMRLGFATSFENRNEGKLPIIEKELNMEKWF